MARRLEHTDNPGADMVGLSRATREVLGLPEYVPSARRDVAAQAWALAAHGQGQPSDPVHLGGESLVEFLVGVVEAIDEFIDSARAESRPDLDLRIRAQVEASIWVDDFLADSPNTADASVLFDVANRLSAALAEGLRAKAVDRGLGS